MSRPVRPVLVVTNHVPPDRAGAFAALHAREGIELALFGGRSHHATAGLSDPGVPYRRGGPRGVPPPPPPPPHPAPGPGGPRGGGGAAGRPGPRPPPARRGRRRGPRGAPGAPGGGAGRPPRRHAVPALERAVGARAHLRTRARRAAPAGDRPRRRRRR